MVELLHARTNMNTDNRALAWPRLCHNLTCFPRRPQYRRSKDLDQPFSTQTPDTEVPHTHVQPRDSSAT